MAARERVLQLDVLRGIAILLVLGRHLSLPRPEGPVGVFAEAWFRLGWLGVDLFFVLSGFLIGGLLLSEYARHGEIHIGRFLVRRGFKIYPPYFVFIGYLLAVPALKALLRNGSPWAAFAEQWSLYWPNLLFLQNYVGPNPAGHTWSLAVEEHFYLLLPFALVALVARGRIRWLLPGCLLVVPIVLLGLCALSVGTNDAFAVRMAATHLRLDALLFGVGIRAAVQFVPERVAGLGQWRWALIAAGLLLWSPNLFVDPGTPFIRIVGLSWTYLGAAAFLVAACHTKSADFGKFGSLGRAAASAIAWIGVHSYAIYLWHVTAIGIFEREIAGRLLTTAGTPGQIEWTVAAALVGGGAVLVGVAAAKVVEWPVLRVRDRWFPSRSGSVPVRGPEASELAAAPGQSAAAAV